MSTPFKLLIALLLIGFAVYRLVLLVRHGTRVHRPTIPTSSGLAPQSLEGVAQGEPFASRLGTRGRLVALLVWLVGNALVWGLLLGIPAFHRVPVIWILFIGVFANLRLIPFARSVAVRSAQRRQATDSG